MIHGLIAIQPARASSAALRFPLLARDTFMGRAPRIAGGAGRSSRPAPPATALERIDRRLRFVVRVLQRVLGTGFLPQRRHHALLLDDVAELRACRGLRRREDEAVL